MLIDKNMKCIDIIIMIFGPWKFETLLMINFVKKICVTISLLNLYNISNNVKCI